MFYILIETFQL